MLEQKQFENVWHREKINSSVELEQSFLEKVFRKPVDFVDKIK